MLHRKQPSGRLPRLEAASRRLLTNKIGMHPPDPLATRSAFSAVGRETSVAMPERISEKLHYRILHNSAEVSLTPYAIIVSPSLRTFETGSGNRPLFSVSFNTAAVTEAILQNADCYLDLIGMIPLQCPSKGSLHGICSALIMFEAVTEIMRIFRLGAMIKREGFETGETDDVGMTNVDRCNTSAVKKFGSDLRAFALKICRSRWPAFRADIRRSWRRSPSVP